MKTAMRPYTFALLALTLSACGMPASLSGAPTALDRTATSAARHAPQFHRDPRASWFSRDAATKSPLLFVSDTLSADVYIYKLPSLKVVARVTGFSEPQGECSDDQGNVWIADTSAQIVYELSHNGHLENEIVDSNGYPVACAWDPTTHDLAVMNLFGTRGSAGGVLVYATPSSTPTIYTNSSAFSYYFGGYDGSGNLFFAALDAAGNFLLSELPKGGSSAQTLKLAGGTIYFPGMVEWSSKRHRLAVGDQSCGNVNAACIYDVAISKQTATIKGVTSLQNSSGGQICDMVQGALYGNQVAGSDTGGCGSNASATYLWPYPAGGQPNHYVANSDSAPTGAAVSR